ncbi:MAG TPA: exosome complex RNA-binding protein Rrp4 [Candidatus Methanomethylophilaceae archaeon]|nr:exosome complex RNA-binding protein Rrp4 [Candidatus Methanomethylophilaceae archaeon]
MDNRNARKPREVVVPGDILDDGKLKAGENTYVLGGEIRAGILGVKSVRQNIIRVIPLGGRYMPVTGDTIIGVVNDIGSSNWMVEVGAPYPAPLHVSEVPWKVAFGDTSKYLNIGDVVMLKILMVDEGNKISVTMKDSGLRKLEGGRLVEISHTKISRVIGKNGSMIQMIKNLTDCRIFIGQNGVIWIDGDGENADVAVKAIEMIDDETVQANLTERVKEFLEKEIPQQEEDKEEGDEQS